MKPMKYYLSLVCCWLAYGTMAQSEVLNQYVQEGLQNSQTLKQQRFQLQKAIWALDEAKSLFKPAVNFNTTVSSALGGRTIDIPVGIW
jgi:outer membrane protein TolC